MCLARLKIGDHELKATVKDEDKAVNFRLKLESGPARIQTWLIDTQGVARGAYYVTIRKLDSPVTTQ